MLPQSFKEAWTWIGNAPPTIDRIILDEDDLSLSVYFTNPVSVYTGYPKILYRDVSTAETSWQEVDGASSPAVITGLKRSHVYQVQAVMEDAQGKRSRPSMTFETRVTG